MSFMCSCQFRCSSSVSPKYLAHFTHFIMMLSILMLDRKSGTFFIDTSEDCVACFI